jgi:hypothetical protein|eukprot:COSAG06_NODE_6690_length_2823_cov_1.177313_1_plen_143_part_00
MKAPRKASRGGGLMLRRLPPRAKFCGESGANSSLFSKNPFRAIGDDPLRQAKRTNRDDQCFKHNVECISMLLQTQPLQLVCEPERSCIVMHIMHGRGAHLGAERRPRRSLEERIWSSPAPSSTLPPSTPLVAAAPSPPCVHG